MTQVCSARPAIGYSPESKTGTIDPLNRPGFGDIQPAQRRSICLAANPSTASEPAIPRHLTNPTLPWLASAGARVRDSVADLHYNAPTHHAAKARRSVQSRAHSAGSACVLEGNKLGTPAAASALRASNQSHANLTGRYRGLTGYPGGIPDFAGGRGSSHCPAWRRRVCSSRCRGSPEHHSANRRHTMNRGPPTVVGPVVARVEEPPALAGHDEAGMRGADHVGSPSRHERALGFPSVAVVGRSQ